MALKSSDRAVRGEKEEREKKKEKKKKDSSPCVSGQFGTRIALTPDELMDGTMLD
jgi:hypothetical protein